MTIPTSHRRTSRITPPRGYVAIKTAFIASETNEIHCIAKEDMRIEGVNGAYVEIKAGEHFYLSRAASLDEKHHCELGEAMFYIVLVDRIGVKRCSCASNKPCKHEIRLRPIVAARFPKPAASSQSHADLVDDNPPRQVIQGPDWCVDFTMPPAKATQPAKTTSPAKDDVPGTLSSNSSVRGGFMNAVFGSSSMTSYRNSYQKECQV